MSREVHRYPDLESLSAAAAAFVASAAEDAVLERGVFTLALSGGSTPRRLYELLALDWPRVQLFWGDERCVPPEHPDSNYRLAREALLDRVKLPPENVHRIPTELPPAQAASAYGALIPPSFDLVLLGLGKDGHTASLFPGDPIIKEGKRTTAAVKAPAGLPVTDRVTLTLPALNAARQALFLVSGAEKTTALKSILYIPAPHPTLPAGMVEPKKGSVWLVC